MHDSGQPVPAAAAFPIAITGRPAAATGGH
jgi:hypothetical protein